MLFSHTMRHRGRLPGIGIPLAIVLWTALVFTRALTCDYIHLDDSAYVFNNPDLQRGMSLDGLRWAMTTFHAGMWIPLTWLSLMFDRMLFGDAAWGYHLTNVLMHAVNAVLLYRLLRQMTGWQWRAALAAALFALHPLRVESVVWITERKDVLSMLLGLLAMSSYVSYARAPTWRKHVLTTLFFVLGLMAKPMLVMLPVMFIVLDFWPLRRWSNPTTARHGRWLYDSLREKGLWLAISLLVSGITVRAQTGENYHWDSPMSLRLTSAVVAYVHYLGITLWPRNLAVLYPRPVSWPAWEVGLCLLMLLIITGVCVAGRRRWPWLLAGWLWYLGAMAPMIGIIQSGRQYMADRFTYLPGIGLLLMLVGSLPMGPLSMSASRRAGAVAAVVLIALSLSTVHQIGYWRDAETASRRALAVTPGDWRLHVERARVLIDLGRDTEAVGLLRRAIDLHPRQSIDTIEQLGLACYRLRDEHQALDCFRQVAAAMPNDTQRQLRAGVLARGLGEYQTALTCLRRSVTLAPRSRRAWWELGLTLKAVDRPAEAADALREVLRLQPEDPDATRALAELAATTRPATDNP
ncbi:MAG: tetratricopeptide repeat protein [Phycisphaeraceae bacterium]|nr:tetratricopeptide repeat protein [Phycisphaeraceae bacterium]